MVTTTIASVAPAQAPDRKVASVLGVVKTFASKNYLAANLTPVLGTENAKRVVYPL